MQLQSAGSGDAGTVRPRRLHTYTRRKHALARPKRYVHSKKSKGDTSLEAIARLLFPYDLDGYPGRTACMLELLRHKVSKWAMYKWRRGTRRAPQWARDIVAAELEKKAAAYLAAASELRNEAK